MTFTVGPDDYFDAQTGFGKSSDLPCGHLSLQLGGLPVIGGPAGVAPTAPCV
jgi:hypothetical protein